ncbi:hypothetical protein BT96DRAFT_1014601 [Gymnopus androsaceus JB14]|uniref:REJ domain-containing protein n=1 Tax=Gymnopus androsaceus JB14 TaxID=1447944 RepID=A0A6A4ICB9_9AGAR|nr:hypothetical protein BT96DRAFT_1014601 [Gymnopus androsaceus JB14]
MFFKNIVLAFVALSAAFAQNSIGVKGASVPETSVPPVVTATRVVVSTDVETSFTTFPGSSITSTVLVTRSESASTPTVSLISHSTISAATSISTVVPSSTASAHSPSSSDFAVIIASTSATGTPSASSTAAASNSAVGIHKGSMPALFALIGSILLCAAMEL